MVPKEACQNEGINTKVHRGQRTTSTPLERRIVTNFEN